ncbi:MAG: Gfo/Idh/MocA family oxidoreductase [Bryobacterales bacterium]|nr:Gfo/Idh/MocA family oxidoreductase [Bryobacterales bacterium]
MAQKLRTLVIGRTARGNYGHNLDVAAKTHPRLDVTAVADDNAEGLRKAADRLQLKNTYADWKQALKQEQPQVVVIAMRWVDCHEEMALACAAAGAHVFMEKPMARTLAECDRMIDACDRTHTRMVVAHNMRCCPILDHVHAKVREGLLGDVLELRARGKEDRRAGGEDMMVLGTHLFDMMRRFAGDPQWAFGRVMKDGREITRADVNMNAPEGLGAIAGDTIEGMYGFANGIPGYFASRKSADQTGTRWALDLVGTNATLRILAGHVPEIWLTSSRPNKEPAWKRMEIPQGIGPVSEPDANHHLIHDLVAAIDERKEPAASGRAARWAIEMAHAMYASHRRGGRVKLPLEQRDNPLLAELKR